MNDVGTGCGVEDKGVRVLMAVKSSDRSDIFMPLFSDSLQTFAISSDIETLFCFCCRSGVSGDTAGDGAGDRD